MNTIESILQWLDKLQGLPAIALVFISCVITGYTLRFIKRFPNDGIPVAVVLWGAVAMLVIADPRASTVPPRIWIMRNLLIGFALGFVAWLIHKALLSKIEDWIAAKFPSILGNTSFFTKASIPTTPTLPTPPSDPKVP